jgi:hypothetical protein
MAPPRNARSVPRPVRYERDEKWLGAPDLARHGAWAVIARHETARELEVGSISARP